LHVVLTTTLVSGAAEAVPVTRPSDTAIPAAATTTFVLDSMESR
jgi:hypothetical protein